MTKQYQDSNKEIQINSGQNQTALFQVSFYVPEDYCDTVKQAMFNAGAGVVGSYQECAWQTLGEGQFKPKDGSQPYIGEVNTLEKVKEFKVEIVCTGEYIEATVMALKSSHPYEVPAFSVIKLESF